MYTCTNFSLHALIKNANFRNTLQARKGGLFMHALKKLYYVLRVTRVLVASLLRMGISTS